MAEYDFSKSIVKIDTNGCPVYNSVQGFGTSGSSCFAAAINLETSSGMEISGLNAAQMSDIQFVAEYTNGQVGGTESPGPTQFQTFVYYDSMLLLKANNVVEMIN